MSGATAWIAGLPCSLSPDLGFSREDRAAQVRRIGVPGASVVSRERIEDRAAFDFVRYANCWEDADVLCEALRARPGIRALSIASAGDNASPWPRRGRAWWSPT